MVDHLPGKPEALSSRASTIKKRKRRKSKQGRTVRTASKVAGWPFLFCFVLF
jgi:hypothetical protein